MNDLQNQFDSFINSSSILTNKYEFNFPLFNVPVVGNITPPKTNAKLLGKRMEDFLHHALEQSDNYQILHNSLQVIDDKVTIGEIDFIINEKNTNHTIHLELAYKFYLFNPKIATNQIDGWVGPNNNDSLHKKLSKLTNKQFPLLHNKATKKSIGETENIKQRLCLLGKLFMPYTEQAFNFNYINKSCLDGFWMSAQDFENKFNKQWDSFFIPEKQHWHTSAPKNEIWLTYNIISLPLKHQLLAKKSPMLWAKKGKQVVKLFITWW